MTVQVKDRHIQQKEAHAMLATLHPYVTEPREVGQKAELLRELTRIWEEVPLVDHFTLSVAHQFSKIYVMENSETRRHSVPCFLKYRQNRRERSGYHRVCDNSTHNHLPKSDSPALPLSSQQNHQSQIRPVFPLELIGSAVW